MLFSDSHDLSLLDFDMFRQLMQKSHKVKLGIFNKKYSALNVDILPHDFYDRIRKLMQKIVLFCPISHRE